MFVFFILIIGLIVFEVKTKKIRSFMKNAAEQGRIHELKESLLEFEIQHPKEVRQWKSKVDKVLDNELDDPKKQLKALENTLIICDEFKQFCYGHGELGSMYYDEFCADKRISIEFEIEYYLDDFESTFDDDICKWTDKIEDSTTNDYDNPDDYIKQLNRTLEFCDKFKDFCYSHGKPGIKYYNESGYEFKSEVERTLKDFMEEEYEDEKAEYEENKEYERAYNKTEKEVLKIVSKDGGILRKDVFESFDENSKSLVTKIINSLVKNGEIEKVKNGKYVFLKVAEKEA